MCRGSVVATGIVLLLATATAHAAPDPINEVLGDTSWTSAFGAPPEPADNATTRVEIHLAFVLDRLRARDITHLSLPQQHRRAAALDALARYLQRGSFPRRTDDPYAGWRPRFIDAAGVHCAVGYLIAESGAPALARAINDAHEYALVRDITTPGLSAWAVATGLTLEELAMIQPTYPPGPSAAAMVGTIERARDAISLACERDYKPTKRRLALVIWRDSGGTSVRATSTDPFALCFVTQVEKIMPPGPGPRGSAVPYHFELVLELVSAEQQLAQLLDRMPPSDCHPPPGAVPQLATVDVTSTEQTFDVHVETSPHRPRLNACIEAQLRPRLAAFGEGAWQLHVRRQLYLPPRIASRGKRRASP